MSRSLIVGLLMAPVLVAAPVPKDDDVGRMRRLYGSVHDPDGGGEFKPSGGSLRIITPQEPRLFGPWCKVFNAPRVWREVQGDFTATVRVTFPIRSKIPAKHPEVSEPRAGGGLVVWTDDENFMTVTRDEREIGDEPGEFFRTEVRNESIAGGCAEYSAPKEFGYLRAQRKGQRFEGSYSTDGTKWKALCAHRVEWGEKVRVGVVAENSFKAPFEIVFDKYVLTLAQQ